MKRRKWWFLKIFWALYHSELSQPELSFNVHFFTGYPELPLWIISRLEGCVGLGRISISAISGGSLRGCWLTSAFCEVDQLLALLCEVLWHCVGLTWPVLPDKHHMRVWTWSQRFGLAWLAQHISYVAICLHRWAAVVGMSVLNCLEVLSARMVSVDPGGEDYWLLISQKLWLWSAHISVQVHISDLVCLGSACYEGTRSACQARSSVYFQGLHCWSNDVLDWLILC